MREHTSQSKSYLHQKKNKGILTYINLLDIFMYVEQLHNYLKTFLLVQYCMV